MGFLNNIYGLANCTVLSETEANDILVLNNTGGTVSVFVDNGLTPIHLGQYCCETILNNPVNGIDIPNTSGYTYSWDSNYQECRWLKRVECDNLPNFNITLNPTTIGNSPFSAEFNVVDGDTCALKVSFDYLIKFDCTELLSITNSFENQQIEQLESELSLLNVDCAEVNLELSTLTSAFTFNYVIVDTSTSQELQTYMRYYCVTSAGLPALKFALEETFPLNVNIWSEYLSTGLINGLTINQLPESQEIFDIVSTFNNSNQGFYLTPCQSTGQDLINTTVDTLSNILTLQGQADGCALHIEQITNQLELLYQTPCLSIVDIFENFNIGMSITKTDVNNLELVSTVFNTPLFNIGSDNLLNYLRFNKDTGIYLSDYNGITCTNDDCDAFARQFISELVEIANEEKLLTGITETQQIYELESLLTEGYFDSNWKTFEVLINDPVIISAITNQNINLNLTVSGSCIDFSILIDRIRFDKICERDVRTDILINENPGFELKRVCDNKKVWVASTEPESRTFNVERRFTQYDTKHHKLVLNSKETTLNMSIAKAIETDVWCYVEDNDCVLQSCESNSGYTATTCCCDGSFELEGIDITGGTVSLPPSQTYACAISIGDSLSGGTVFWVNPNNSCEALVVSTINLSGSSVSGPIYNLPWTNNCSNQFMNLTNVDIFGGLINTQLYVSDCQNDVNTAMYVANQYNGGGFSDWYLPNRTEMALLADNLPGLLDSGSNYWTSTENTSDEATYLVVDDNTFEVFKKSSLYKVRAIRKVNSSPCSQVYDTITGVTNTDVDFTTEELDCKWIYKFDNDPSTSKFDGFWVAGHNDSTIGVYKHITESGNTGTTIDYTDIITEDCCISYDLALRNIEEKLHLGRHLKNLYWDPACKKCKFKRCETSECIDLTDVIQTGITGCTEIEIFENTANSGLINISCRKISNSYPLLNLVYQRYLNSNLLCETESSKFTYDSMIDFSGLITTYWVDLIEQVIPSTTIWVNNHIYGNSIYHQQKFIYRTGTVIPCSNNNGTPNTTKYFTSMIPFTHTSENPNHKPPVDVELYYLNSEGLCVTSDKCSDIFYYNGDCGSEFIGVITDNSNGIISQ